MSYTVEVPGTWMENWVEQGGRGGWDAISVTTFAGGQRGRMIQVTLDGEFICLTLEQVDDLVEVLTFARGQSLVDHPRCRG